MSRGPDAHTLLVRALYRSGCAVGCPPEIVVSDWTRWSSATFAGVRHAMTWRAPPGPALDRWLAGLPEAEFTLRGHLVADLSVCAVTRIAEAAAFEIEALTVAL